MTWTRRAMVGSGGVRRCPRCGGAALRPVATAGGSGENLLCLGCRRCWRPEDGYLVQVNPYACAGCPDRRFCMFLVDSPAIVRDGATGGASTPDARRMEVAT